MTIALSMFRGVICRMRHAPDPQSIEDFATFAEHYHAPRSDRRMEQVHADRYGHRDCDDHFAYSTFGPDGESRSVFA